MEFTDSVRSRQVPATPFTSAWPPSSPSVPTSRATRVTSEANELSWSTMVLMVFFSSRISPRASTVMRVERSPLATAVVTAAMLRTWLVRLEAMEFTDSVRSFHVPATPGTTAWPPSLPSEPTSRATRVTSEAKALSRPTMVLTTRAVRRNSPLRGRPSTSSAMVTERSPLATAVMTRATSVEGCTTSPIRVLRESTQAAQPPPWLPRLARRLMRPSLPTELEIRANSRVIFSFSSTISFSVSAILASTPLPSNCTRAEKSPRRKADKTFKSSRLSSASDAGTLRELMLSPRLDRMRPLSQLSWRDTRGEGWMGLEKYSRVDKFC